MTSLSRPSFEGRFLKAVYCQGEPDRVPLVEAGIDSQIKARFLGRPLKGLADEIAFWASAGYDFIPLESGLRTIIDAAIHHEKAGRFENPPGSAVLSDAAVQVSQVHPGRRPGGIPLKGRPQGVDGPRDDVLPRGVDGLVRRAAVPQR